MKAFWTLLKREYWEYRSTFLYIPAIIGALLSLVVVCAIIVLSVSVKMNVHTMPSNLLSNLTTQGVGLGLFGSSFPFAVILWFLVLYYFISCLYDDRKNGSIYFWSSMPLTQTQIILSKLITGLIVAPLLTWLCIIATNLILLVLFSIAAMIFHLGSVAVIWNPTTISSTWIMILFSFFKQGLWLFPIAGWFMVCSAYARKAPFLRAIVPVIIIIILEMFFTQHHYFTNFVRSHFFNVLVTWSQSQQTLAHMLQGVIQDTKMRIVFNHREYIADLSLMNILAGVAVGIIFMVIAGILRFKCHDFTK